MEGSPLHQTSQRYHCSAVFLDSFQALLAFSGLCSSEHASEAPAIEKEKFCWITLNCLPEKPSNIWDIEAKALESTGVPLLPMSASGMSTLHGSRQGANVLDTCHTSSLSPLHIRGHQLPLLETTPPGLSPPHLPVLSHLLQITAFGRKVWINNIAEEYHHPPTTNPYWRPKIKDKPL